MQNILINIKLINKKYYHSSYYYKCFFNFFNKVIKITEQIQFLKLDKKTNLYFREQNRIIFDHYLKWNKINRFQHKGLLANNKKSFEALDHPGFFFKYNGLYYFLPQTSHLEGSIRKLLTLEQIKSGKPIIYQEAESIKFIEILNKYYTPVFYNLGNEEHIQFYKFNGIESMNFEQIQEFENFINKNREIFGEISLESYVKPYNILKNLEEFNIEIKNKNEE